MYSALPSEQVVRQRDTLRQLLQSSGNNLETARQAYVHSVGQASPGAASPAPTGTPQPAGAQQQQHVAAPAGPDYRALYADAEQQFKEYKEEVNKTQQMLSQDLARVRDEASAAKSGAVRARAEAEFERDRSGRLTQSLEMQRQQLEGLMGSNAKYQSLVTDIERKLSEAQAAADEARDTVRKLWPGFSILAAAAAAAV